MVGAVRGEHALHGDPQRERPRFDRLLKGRKVSTAVLGDIGTGEKGLEHGRVADRPGAQAEDVHGGGRATSPQRPVFGVPVGTGGIDDEREGLGHLSSPSGRDSGAKGEGLTATPIRTARHV
ncbi:hypothetical protein GCM10027612_09000 [Microbispora bryophytorum subsp. camponoti]